MAQEGAGDAKERGIGLLGSLKALVATMVAIAHTRLELFGEELQEEITRLGSLLVWGYVALFFASLAVLFLALVILIACWDTPYRLLVAIGLAVLFLALAAVAVGFVVNLLKSKKRLFDASLGELERDEAELGDGR
jgi:uncharacterized membrane protein YqjE